MPPRLRGEALSRWCACTYDGLALAQADVGQMMRCEVALSPDTTSAEPGALPSACAGAEAGRDAILAAGMAPLLPAILQHGDEDAKEAAVWCVINLTTSGAEHPGAVRRVAALREAGAPTDPQTSSAASCHAAAWAALPGCVQNTPQPDEMKQRPVSGYAQW